MKNDDEKKPAWKPTSSELSETMATSANVAELAPVSKNQNIWKIRTIHYYTVTFSSFHFSSSLLQIPVLHQNYVPPAFLFSRLCVIFTFCSISSLQTTVRKIKSHHCTHRHLLLLPTLIWIPMTQSLTQTVKWRKNRQNSPHISTSSAFFCCLSNRIVVLISRRL